MLEGAHRLPEPGDLGETIGKRNAALLATRSSGGILPLGTHLPITRSRLARAKSKVTAQVDCGQDDRWSRLRLAAMAKIKGGHGPGWPWPGSTKNTSSGSSPRDRPFLSVVLNFCLSN